MYRVFAQTKLAKVIGLQRVLCPYLIVTAALAGLAVTPAAWGQTTWYVDDDAPNDPAPGDPTISDPLEDGSVDHPFDAIQEGIDAATDGDTVLVADGTYTGLGNKNLDYAGKAITVRSENGPDNCIIYCERDGRGFYFHSGETAASVVDGFTIASGDVDDGSPGDGYGGGIYCLSSPTITNCVISGNEAQSSGGGIYCGSSSNAMISNCVIINNRVARTGSYGGGIHCAYGNPTIVNCLIKSNVAPFYGGGISCDSSSPEIIGCTISQNISDTAGGGIRCSYDSNPVLRDCVICENVATAEYGDYAFVGGGGIYCNVSSPTIVNSVIKDNTAVASGGGIVIFSGSGVTSMPTIAHCVISGNSADAGGGIHLASGMPTVVNSVVRGNAPEQVAVSDDEPVITYCNIEGGWAGEGNIDADPLFAFDDDYRILSGSPGIDAGTNDVPGGVLWEDIDGSTRPLDGDGDSVAVADIGLHEFTGDMPSVALSSRELEFFVHEDEPSTAEHTLLIRNCGGATLNWEINVPCSWLVVDPSSGESNGEINEVVVSVDTTGLSHGKYVCDLSVMDPDAANSPQTVHVILHVATTLAVPSEYPTIRAAMDAATVAGDLVLVADGVYAGAGNKNLDFRGRAITVCSENGPWNCIIDCVGGGRAFNFDSREAHDSIVEGFTITHGREDVGGAIRCHGYCTPIIRNCVLTRNEAVGGLPNGRGGAIMCAYFADPAIVNCVFAENSAVLGGAVFALNDSRPTLTNCTITDNTAREDGSGVSWKKSNPLLANCVVWGNTGAQLYSSGEGTITVSYSNIQGGWEGEGNIEADPLFAFADDPHLLVDSPCIDSATNDPPGGLPSTDLDGNPRPIDGDEDGEAVADMGACEFDPAQPAIGLSPPILEFYTSEGQTGLLEQSLAIRNAGTGTLNWEIIPQDPRVTVEPSSGASGGEVDDVVVTVDVDGLPHGVTGVALLIHDPQVAGCARTAWVFLYATATLHVPGTYLRIQDAIDAASFPGDVVLVADGNYTGPGNKELDLRGRSITVRSENGPTDCVIDCEGDGRGFHLHSGETAQAIIEGFTVTNGYAPYGGGILCEQASPLITDCVLLGNQAEMTGGGVYCELDWPKIAGCQIIGNQAGGGGGGVRCYNAWPLIVDCHIAENGTLEEGGGLRCDHGEVAIVNCDIRGNAAGMGGGLYTRSCPTRLVNCAVLDNGATEGGGVYAGYRSDLDIAHCTFAANEAVEGGGVRCSRCSATFANSVVWGNMAEEGAQLALYKWDSHTSSARVLFSDFQDGAAGVYVDSDCTLEWDAGNIDADPLFVDPNDGDFRLSVGSPCIDAGCNCAVPDDSADLDGDGVLWEYVPFDLDGEGRFFDDPDTPDTGSGVPPIVDMGAYEFGGSDLPPCHGDLDGDRDVDMADLAVLLAHYGMTSGANGADGDMDCDGDIQLADLAEFLGAYGDVCE